MSPCTNISSAQPDSKPVVTYFLEMRNPEELVPAAVPLPDLAVRQARQPCLDLNRMFYETVGRVWNWRERLSWSRDKWRAYVERPELTTWIGYVADTPFGYFELETQPGADIEIAIFGLLPEFVGRGLGGYLLTECVRAAWALGAKRVWVHTCSEDHPAALANYQARGFRLYHQTTDPVPRVVPGYSE